jgi:Zn-finger nucleic acid-binding protein
MICPGCAAEMAPMRLAGRLGTTVDVDACTACHAFWFDEFESLRLAPASILKLFHLVAEHDDAGQPSARALACPRCLSPLTLTHDRQNTTKFEYWRCAKEHGRFITFLNFLREKDFVRPPSPGQLAELRASVQTINCSNCGGPIDLASDSVCRHCGSPLTILDVKQMMASWLKSAK